MPAKADWQHRVDQEEANKRHIDIFEHEIFVLMGIANDTARCAEEKERLRRQFVARPKAKTVVAANYLDYIRRIADNWRKEHPSAV